MQHGAGRLRRTWPAILGRAALAGVTVGAAVVAVGFVVGAYSDGALDTARGAVLSAGGGLALSALLAKLTGAGLFTRIDDDDLLEHPKRAAIHRLVTTEPGVTLQDIRRRLDLGWGTTNHHVRRLADAGLVVSEHTNGHRVYPVGDLPAARRTEHALLQGDTTRRIATYLASHGGATQTDLCDRLDVSKSVASKHLAKLEDAELVVAQRDGHFKRYHATGELHGLLARGDLPDSPPVREDAHADLTG